jgi:hypothetical protein
MSLFPAQDDPQQEKYGSLEKLHKINKIKSSGLSPDVSLRLITQGVLVDLSIAELVHVVVTLVLPELHL